MAINGSNNDLTQLLILDPQIGLDLGLINNEDQATGGGGSASNTDLLEQKCKDILGDS